MPWHQSTLYPQKEHAGSPPLITQGANPLMTMSRQDFATIADTIAKLSLSPPMKAYIAHQFADALASTNPRFDRARFEAAAVPSL